MPTLHSQQTTNNKQQTTNNKQQTTNNKQQTTNNKQHYFVFGKGIAIFTVVPSPT